MALISYPGAVIERTGKLATVHSYRTSAGHCGVCDRIGTFDVGSIGAKETRPPKKAASDSRQIPLT